MAHESTCWTVIAGAAAGNADDRDDFARRYGPVVRSYLLARWRSSAWAGELDDAVQDVFVECFKQGGMLERAEPGGAGGFRAFLYGVVRNVALRVEARRARDKFACATPAELEAIEAEEEPLSRTFDRAWAKAILRESARRQEERARSAGEQACRRVELLRLRFHEGLPIRAIAERWQMDAAGLHREYARARQEFKEALLEVVAFHHPGTAAEVERESADLLALLG
jgi:RNA polymerase sigma-70 factor (ECF subfamily)